MPPTKQPMYRLAEGVTCVPDKAPKHLRWHNLDNAIRDIQAWVRESGHTGGLPSDYGPREYAVWANGPFFEVRVVEVVDLPTDIDPRDSESGGCPYVARVKARIYVERRQYRDVRDRVTANVDGIEAVGFGPTRCEYMGDWFAGWRHKSRWHEGERAYNTVSIPIVRDEIEWADDAPTPAPAEE